MRLLTNGTKDPATVEAFQKALEMTDWKAQQKVICAAQNALAAAGQKVKVMSECSAEADSGKTEAKAEAAPAGKEDKKDDKKGDKKGDKKESAPADAHAAVHWDYEGAMGPENWGKEFPTCGKGKSQAPLNIKGPF